RSLAVAYVRALDPMKGNAVVVVTCVLLLAACATARQPVAGGSLHRTDSLVDVPSERNSPCPTRPERHPAPGEMRPISAVLDPAEPLLIESHVVDLGSWSS